MAYRFRLVEVELLLHLGGKPAHRTVVEARRQRQRLHAEGYDTIPSELFKRQCYMVGWYDTTGLKTREHTGLKSLLWSTNFPQSTTTWPESREAIKLAFDGIPDNERRQVLVDNAAKLYNIA